MCVLDDEQCRRGARQRRGVDQGRQPTSAGIRSDLGRRHVRVGASKQVIQQLTIAWIRVGIPFPDAGAGRFAVEISQQDGRTQHLRHHPEGHVTGV